MLKTGKTIQNQRKRKEAKKSEEKETRRTDLGSHTLVRVEVSPKAKKRVKNLEERLLMRKENSADRV